MPRRIRSRRVPRAAVDLDLVDALDAALAREEPRRQRAVVREQQEPLVWRSRRPTG
jgi:hypothetical protein